MTRPYATFARTQLWRAVEQAVLELQATGEVRLATAPEYVIGYLCQELVARDVVADRGLAERGTSTDRAGGVPDGTGDAAGGR